MLTNRLGQGLGLKPVDEEDAQARLTARWLSSVLQGFVHVVEPRSSRSETGRPPFAIQTMLRIYSLQHWFGLSDETREVSERVDTLRVISAIHRATGPILRTSTAVDATLIWAHVD
jgi:hypothetical protein